MTRSATAVLSELEVRFSRREAAPPALLRLVVSAVVHMARVIAGHHQTKASNEPDSGLDIAARVLHRDGRG